MSFKASDEQEVNIGWGKGLVRPGSKLLPEPVTVVTKIRDAMC